MARAKKRRSYGIGRKFKRGEIWWVSVYDGSGNEIRKSSKSNDERAADELLGQMLRERSRGELVAIDSPAAVTIGDLIDQYIYRRSKLAPGTIRTYRYQAEILKESFGMIPPPKLTTDMLSDYRDERAK